MSSSAMKSAQLFPGIEKIVDGATHFEEEKEPNENLRRHFLEPFIPYFEALHIVEKKAPRLSLKIYRQLASTPIIETQIGDFLLENTTIPEEILESISVGELYLDYKKTIISNLEEPTDKEIERITNAFSKYNLPFEIRNNVIVYMGPEDKKLDYQTELFEISQEDTDLSSILDHFDRWNIERMRESFFDLNKEYGKLIKNGDLEELAKIVVEELSSGDEKVKEELSKVAPLSMPNIYRKLAGPLTSRKGFTNGYREPQKDKISKEKKKFSLSHIPKIAVSVLGVGLMVGGAIAGSGILGEPSGTTPTATDWQQEYWDNVFFHLNNTTENQNFTSDFLNVYNASDWEHYNATRDLVSKGGINPMWLARYIAGNMWSREEFDILPDVFNVNSSLRNYGNLSLIFTEVDNLQKDNGGINASEEQMIDTIFNSYLNLSSLEQKSLFLTPMNKTNEPSITTAGKSQNELQVTDSDIKALDTAKPMDTGDLMWWLWTNFSAQKGIDINNVTQEKVLWAYLSIFDGFLDNNRDWNDEAVLDYMSQQFDEFGLKNLTDIANFPNSLIWLQQKIWPQTLFTKYASSGSDKFDSGVFWINHSWNGTLVNAYKQARQFWKDNNLDNEVVGKSGSAALTSLETWIDANLNAGGGNEPPLGNFTLFYENFFSKFLQGYKVDLGCESLSTTANFLIRTQNHLYLNNNVVTNESGASKIPLTAFQVQMYDGGGTGHTDVGYIGYNNTLYNVKLTLSDSGWTVFSGNKSKPDYQVQIPPAFWYEIKSPWGVGYHDTYGQVDVNIRGDDVWLPYYNISAIPANETNQETNYSKAVDYVEKAREGAIKGNFGYGNAPYSRGVYDLLNKDNVAIPEFQDTLIPTFAAIAVTLGMYRRKRRKKD